MPPIPDTQVCAHSLHFITAISLPHSIFEATTWTTKGVICTHEMAEKVLKGGTLNFKSQVPKNSSSIAISR